MKSQILKLVATILLAINFNETFSQCSVLPLALPGPVTLQCAGGTNNRSGLAYHPVFGIYYSVNAGNAGYPIEAFDLNGSLLLSTAQGNDYRGYWWNDSLSQLEGNSYAGYGIVSQDLDPNGLPLGTVTTIFSSNTQPDAQSCGVLDWNNNWILYNWGGVISAYGRYTNVLAGTTSITGLPASTINTTSLIYTGCPGNEIGLYDFINSRIYFIDQNSGAYTTTCQLPPTSTTNDRFRLAFVNNYLWVFNPVSLIWESFIVFQSGVGVEENFIQSTAVYPNPVTTSVTFYFANQLQDAEVILFDVTGKELKKFTSVNGNKFLFSRDELPSGIYFYEVMEKTAAISRGKLVIN